MCFGLFYMLYSSISFPIASSTPALHRDQASVLVQIGLLEPEGLLVAGIASAKKLLDETLPSNHLIKEW